MLTQGQPHQGILRSLESIRARGEVLEVGELAQRLLSLANPVEPHVARRLVAAVLDRPADSLPERLDAEQLRPTEELAVAGLRVESASFVVVDLETTGLSPDKATILEIGAVRVTGLETTERFETLVRPPAPIPRPIADLTGIDDFMVRDAPPVSSALRAFRRWLARTPEAPFVAHNAGFDWRFVSRGLEAEALPPYAVPVLCTRKLGRRIAPEIGRYDLDHLCAHFHIPNRARHRAMGDAAATATALVELLRLVRSRHEIETLGELLDFQRKPVRRRRRRRKR